MNSEQSTQNQWRGRWAFIDEERKISENRKKLQNNKKSENNRISHCKKKWSAGVIPYCFVENQMHVLVGREKREKHEKQHTWCEFGGRNVETEKRYIETAVNKFSQESMGMFSSEVNNALSKKGNNVEILANLLNSCRVEMLAKVEALDPLKDYMHYDPRGNYHVVLLELPHVDPGVFSELKRRSDVQQQDPISYKTDVAWVPIDQVMMSARGDRPFVWQKSPDDEPQYFNSYFMRLVRETSKLIEAIRSQEPGQ